MDDFVKRYGFFDAVDIVKYEWADDFDRAANFSAFGWGGNWTLDTTGTACYCFIRSPGVAEFTGSPGGGFGNNFTLIPTIPRATLQGLAQYSQLRYLTFTPSSDPVTYFGPCAFSGGLNSAGSRKSYIAQLTITSTKKINLIRLDADHYTNLVTDIATFVEGDVIRIEVRPYANRNELVVLKNGVIVCQYTDSSAERLVFEGYPTILVPYLRIWYDNCDLVQLSNFKCGAL